MSSYVCFTSSTCLLFFFFPLVKSESTNGDALHLKQDPALGTNTALNILIIVNNYKTLYNCNASVGFPFSIGLNLTQPL